ncbi:MAG: aminomethyl-transferring glycine dehydrogenase subunit GcvPA [Planctomycetota bacterium]|jgi:glycine dehydrogenase subunit 1
MPFLPNTEADVRKMLSAIGISSIEDLFAYLPDDVRFNRNLDLPAPMTEMEMLAHGNGLAAKNINLLQAISFLGAGAYHHYIPAAVDELSQRAEFYTAYTPYQPETSQGVLQAFFEYQTLIAELTGMDVSNASMYDGGSALAEAVLLARGTVRKGSKVIFPANLHPEYRNVVKTYLRDHAAGYVEIRYGEDGRLDMKALTDELDDAFAVVLQSPNFFGVVEDGAAVVEAAHGAGAIVIGICDPVTLMLVSPPGEYGADLAVGDAQSCGIPPYYGGPHLGFFAARQKYVRKMPGRLVGQTTDADGKRGFVLTLQPREQHIRREKATSNICTNHALCALRATIYMSLLGRGGMEKVAMHGLQKAHYLADKLGELKGCSLRFSGPFCREFVLKCPSPADGIIRKLSPKNIFAGVPLSWSYPEETDSLLIAVTEMNSRSDCDMLVEALKEVEP